MSYKNTTKILCFDLLVYFYYLKFFFNVYLFLREWAWAGEGQREGETQNPKQAPGSELSAQGPMRGLNSQTVRSWPKPKSDAQPTESPRRPYVFLFLKLIYILTTAYIKNAQTDNFPKLHTLVSPHPDWGTEHGQPLKRPFSSPPPHSLIFPLSKDHH